MAPTKEEIEAKYEKEVTACLYGLNSVFALDMDAIEERKKKLLHEV